MKKIIRIHQKILDNLLELRKNDPHLFFVPRKINNKNRLQEGYWFLGNERYLHLSFWNGTDWKERINNIGFVILDDGHSYIELSSQDSDIKAAFLKKIVDRIGGFKKDGLKNKWHKYYSSKDYLAHLNDFVSNTKPLIDNLFKTENPEDISLLNQKFFNSYVKRIVKLREEQIRFGRKNKLCRICWNTESWKFPSGSKGKSVSAEAYEADSGYGHEEWLFDKSKIVEDYHYAFLQPLFLKTDKHTKELYNISLFTINNLNKQYFVGEINNVECISRKESLKIYQIYKANGWFEQMKADVEKVGADYKKFIQAEPEIFFNIRFKFKDVLQHDELIEVAQHDINITTNRYKLLPRKSEIKFEIENTGEEEGNLRNTNTRVKVFNSDCEYDPYHDKMQNAIFELLKGSEKYSYKKVCIERDRVDIKAQTKENTWHFFELKTDNPKQSIRKALGQILEYAFYPDLEKAEKLIIVGDEQPNQDVIKYLEKIRTKFNLPIWYRHFDLDTNKLSDDY